MLPIVAFSVALLCLFAAGIEKKDVFTPARVYLFTQSATLGIAFLQLDSLMSDWQMFTWTVFLGGGAAFLLGNLTVHWIAPVNCHANLLVLQNHDPKRYNWGLHMALSFLVWIAYGTAAIALIRFAGGFPLLSNKLGRIMTVEIGEILGQRTLLLMSSPLVIVLFGIAAFERVNPNRKLRILARFIVVIQLVIMVLVHPSRNTIFFSLGILALYWNYLRKPISSWFLLGGLALLLVLFVYLGTMRSQYYGGASMKSMSIRHMMHIPYMYVANNYWNLDYALNPPTYRVIHPTTYGFEQIAGATNLVLGNKLRNAYGWDDMFNQRASKEAGLNTIHYLWDIYKDWREFGVVFVPYVLGILVAWLRIRLRMAGTLRLLILYSMAIYFIGWWWFVIAYKNTIYWIWVAVILLVTAVCQPRGKVLIGKEE